MSDDIMNKKIGDLPRGDYTWTAGQKGFSYTPPGKASAKSKANTKAKNKENARQANNFLHREMQDDAKSKLVRGDREKFSKNLEDVSFEGYESTASEVKKKNGKTTYVYGKKK